MEKKLKWNAVGLETKTRLLLRELEATKDALDPAHLAKVKTVQGLIDEVRRVVAIMDRIKAETIPRLESRFRLTFKTPELIFLALCRPAMRTTFENLAMFFNARGKQLLAKAEFDELAACGDAGEVLALIGDAAIDLAIVETMWDSSRATVGNLTTTRASIVSNMNISKLCDQLGLHHDMIDRANQPSKADAKDKAIFHEKGTLVEAIFGVVYLEFGFQEVMRLVPLLQ